MDGATVTRQEFDYGTSCCPTVGTMKVFRTCNGDGVWRYELSSGGAGDLDELLLSDIYVFKNVKGFRLTFEGETNSRDGQNRYIDYVKVGE